MSLPASGTKIATFDTKTSKPRLPGSAAKAAEKQLRGKGGKPLAAPRSFWVNVDSSLVDGEVAAARTWGDHLAAALAKP